MATARITTRDHDRGDGGHDDRNEEQNADHPTPGQELAGTGQEEREERRKTPRGAE